MKQVNMKTPLVFRIGLALLCAMILSTHLMGNLYARYSTTAVGSDRARVAKFDVTAEIVDNNDGTYTLKITNNSEVTVSYSLSFYHDEQKLDENIQIMFAKGNSGIVPYNASVEGLLTVEDNSTASHPELNVTMEVMIEQVD